MVVLDTTIHAVPRSAGLVPFSWRQCAGPVVPDRVDGRVKPDHDGIGNFDASSEDVMVVLDTTIHAAPPSAGLVPFSWRQCAGPVVPDRVDGRVKPDHDGIGNFDASSEDVMVVLDTTIHAVPPSAGLAPFSRRQCAGPVVPDRVDGRVKPDHDGIGNGASRGPRCQPRRCAVMETSASVLAGAS